MTNPRMSLSNVGLDLIRFNEGLKLTAYRDSAGILTIGYGHTGGDVREGKTITLEEAEGLLRSDVRWAECAVNEYVLVSLNQNQFDALVDFCYNVGRGSFRYSTLLRLLNEGKYELAAMQLKRWNKATVDGKLVEVPGLSARRERERLLFCMPTSKERNHHGTG